MWPQANPCWSLCRPHGKSYLYFTQFKAEVQGAEIEYGMAYVSTGCVGVRALGDRKDGDRDTEHLEGEFGRTWGTAQTPRPGSAGGQGCAHRGAGSRHPCVPVQPPASHLLGEPALSQRAGAWVLGPGTATGAAGGSGSPVCVGAHSLGSVALGFTAPAAHSATHLTLHGSPQREAGGAGSKPIRWPVTPSNRLLSRVPC